MNFESLTKMLVKEKREILINHAHLKFGVALAISVGGIIYTFFVIKRIKPPKSKPLKVSPGNGGRAISREESGDHGDDHRALQSSIISKNDEHKREIKSLRSKIKILEERETNLDIQLLEYYGLKEQETAVMELQDMLSLNTMEAKLYNPKIESLKLDNERLEAQVADYAKAVNELEAAKAKIKLLKKNFALKPNKIRNIF
ncbi:hypothetical protein BUALT_Bualt02G0118700 [Buddleja alternifolia]|uniref:Uncharacterized protein n=1 Tax=Buddleja alternifolia TaxID=168488 RepID=A0AAV6Y124_9LAMI|nr:hypothetical protein BUALT_Bualt02G0118700 [Buddleja alternifolia]